ncbi:MAG: isochorismatase family protein [Deltaproteobacteria bacterium]|nr:isochorismatase family protein [Deltaproteobacteria bacterium]
MRHHFVAEREKSLLLLIDLQEAMAKVIEEWQETVRRVNQLIGAAEILDIPILVTEHYRKGLGETLREVGLPAGKAALFQKEYFSACLEEDFLKTVAGFNRKQVVVAGMETHVCVLQTALDLIQAGYQVHLVKNAVASRFQEDRQAAVDLFREAGAVITTAEIVIFQWARRSNTDLFRKLLPIVK